MRGPFGGIDADICEAFVTYNDYAREIGWPIALKLTPGRVAHTMAALKLCGGIDGWRTVLERAAASAFLRGDIQSNWRPDLDWFLEPDHLQRVSEGRYNGRNDSLTENGLTNLLEKAVRDNIDEGGKFNAEAAARQLREQLGPAEIEFFAKEQLRREIVVLAVSRALDRVMAS